MAVTLELLRACCLISGSLLLDTTSYKVSVSHKIVLTMREKVVRASCSSFKVVCWLRQLFMRSVCLRSVQRQCFRLLRC